ncbi:MFS transporter [Alkalibaculum sp. M08DMB]|uniref:MFS transporter n=1 Tax=Alkalibaculum sporogenes TaxID=2655001 RepID=A0A6A7K5X2_9FIRM|nr:MFS transporter [Alkalibaculum sporogenes]MPW24543.1 MFS transporter [Alkalibaculum sporogenes]
MVGIFGKKASSTLWTKNFILFSGLNLFLNLGVQFLIPILPLYAISVLGASESQVGYLLGLYSFAALAARPFAGYAYDHFGRKKPFVIALIAFSILSFLYNFTATFILLVILRVIHGLAFSFTTTGTGAIVGDIVPSERRGEGIGYFGMTNTLAMALGPAIALSIMGNNNYWILFALSGFLAISAFLMSNFVHFPKIELSSKPFNIKTIFEKKVFSVVLVVLMFGVINGGVLSFIIIYSQDIGIINGGLFFLINSIGVITIRLFTGKIMDIHGPRPMIIFGFIIQSIGLVLLSAANGIFLFLTAAVLLGVANGTLMPTLQTMVMNMVESNKRGVANATFFAAMDIGVGGGSILLGLIAELASFKIMYLFCAVYLVIPLIYFLSYVSKDYERKIVEIDTTIINEKFK